MSYKSAASILPAELVKEIQKYVDGEYLYIPSRARKSWGSRNGAKELFAERDAALFREYENGAGMEALSEKILSFHQRDRKDTHFTAKKGKTARRFAVTGKLQTAYAE